MDIYVVKAGDTVNSIADRYGVEPQTIIYVNQLAEPYQLAIGQAILILTGNCLMYKGLQRLPQSATWRRSV